ncbi:phosphatidylserine/phosphatidylglycerophosphate/cardiolipin synthase family protein [Pseudomaricurvus alcaniphilus]|uniref:phospholipase D-like domain-containing protein n=1 Tax=Pseudomaricurvus alcaniphilus TaxID=1166482 RepID=UPI00140A1831|nr:phosphatidylserine/phosphatidylglycerophosphate/cardiolipin synthase family protein [Pseudomaricurvus alcaniphilus]
MVALAPTEDYRSSIGRRGLTVMSQDLPDRLMRVRRRLLLPLLGPLLLAACQSLQPHGSFNPSHLDERNEPPLIAQQAFFTSDQFYIRFHRGADEVYAGGAWADKISLSALVDSQNAEHGPFVLPLQYEQTEPWPLTRQDAFPVTILGMSLWQAFRQQLFQSIIPTQAKSGIVVHFPTDDYFFYHDENGEFRTILLQYKPGEYSVFDTISSAQLVVRGRPLLQKFLQQKGIDDEHILFNTGDAGPYSLPFLYVNTRFNIPVFVRQQPLTTGPGSNRAGGIVKAGVHLVNSHLRGFTRTPISSVYRLFFLATDTLTETLRPNWLGSFSGLAVPPLNSGEMMDLSEWELRLDSLTNRKTSHGGIHYLVDGEAFFTRFSDAVTSARTSIALRMYIFDDDDYALKIADMLKRKSNQGVEVRVLLDGLGTILSTVEQQTSLPGEHVSPHSMKSYLRRDSEVKVRLSGNPWMTGDHVKSVVIDNRRAFLGGMNIAREYRYDWHDVMMEIDGPVVAELQHEFNKAWAHASFLGDFGFFLEQLRGPPDDGEQAGNYPLRLLYTKFHNAEIFRIQRQAMRFAKQRIYVENPYFTDDAMLKELVKARYRGVDVRVILPLVTDRGPITRNNILAANIMLEHGIRVYLYPGMSHVKAAVFDGWACLGSANWDRLSLQINKEINIATSAPEAVNELVTVLFEADFVEAEEIIEPFPVRWQDHLLEKFGDYLF